MNRYFIKRILLFFPSIFIVLILTMILGHFSGEIPPDLYNPNRVGDSEKLIESHKKKMGLNEPFFYYTVSSNKILGIHIPVFNYNGSSNRFHRYLKSIIDGSLGYSHYYRSSVWTVIKLPLLRTVIINVIALILVYLIGLSIGYYQALHKNSNISKALEFIGQILYAFPSFWLALILLWLFSNRQMLYLFPTSGWEWNTNLSLFQSISNWAWHIFLPLLSLSAGGVIYVAMIFREKILSEQSKPYFRSLKARGFSEAQILKKYLLKMGMIPIVAIATGIFPLFISGSVLIENIFSIPGMGNLAYNSFLTKDFQVIYAITILGTMLTWLNWVLADYLYTKIDSRVKYE